MIDLIHIIIEAFISKEGSLNITEIVDNTGFEKNEILKSLSIMIDMGIVYKEKKDLINEYRLNKVIDGVTIVKASGYGIDILMYDTYFNISNKDKQLALEISSQIDKVRKLELDKRKPLIYRKIFFDNIKGDDISDNLMLIYEAANNVLYEYLENKKNNDEHLALLMDIHKQTEESFKNYINSK